MKLKLFDEKFKQGLSYFSNSDFYLALQSFDEAIKINPRNSRLHRVRGNCLRVVGLVEEAVRSYRESLDIEYSEQTHSRMLNACNYLEVDGEKLAAEYLRYGEDFCRRRQGGYSPHLFSEIKNRKIRIGYISPDFKSHPVSYFLLPIIENHNREKFEIYCYYNSDVEDTVTNQYKKADISWKSVNKFKTLKFESLILKDKIDVLVDLAGHTSGNRLDVFCRKPARVQVTYLGYPNTTGLECIDYRIVDKITDQYDSQRYHSESLFRLDGCFLCYRPQNDIVDIESSLNSHLVFGTFNKISKITNKMISLWVNILKNVPNSKFLLKSHGLESPEGRQHLVKRFIDKGLSDPEKIITYGLTSSRSDHLRLYNEMHIALDTYPYNGTTTTVQALWMGVPVVTLAGNRHISRVSSSILTAVGMPELIAKDEREYVDIATRLASQIERNCEYKTVLRNKLLSSELCNEEAFTRKLEGAYEEMLREKGYLR